MALSGTDVSVIVATKNRPGTVERCVRFILAQTVDVGEIVIVDQSADANEEQLSLLFASAPVLLKYVHVPSCSGLTAARNVGVGHSDRELCLFLDDDMEIAHDFVEQILDVISTRPEAVGVAGRIVNYQASLVLRALRKLFFVGPFNDDRQTFYLRGSRQEAVRARWLGGGIAVYRRFVCVSERFSEEFRGYCFGEDAEFSDRASSHGSLWFASRACGVHRQERASNLDQVIVHQRFKVRWWMFYFLYRTHSRDALVAGAFLLLFLGNALIAFRTSIRFMSFAPAVAFFADSIDAWRRRSDPQWLLDHRLG